MKKLLLVAMTAMLCLCIAMPAAADLKITGMLWVDAYMRSMDKDSLTLNYGAVPGRVIEGVAPAPASVTTYGKISDLQVNMPYSNSNLTFAYANQAGNMGAVFTLFAGGVNDWVNWHDMGTQASMWFKPAKSVTLRLGKIDQFIGGLYPGAPGIGNSEYYRKLADPANTSGVFDVNGILAGPSAGQVPAAITFGNLHTTAKYGLDASFVLTPAMTLKVALFEPDVDGTINWYAGTGFAPEAGKRGVVEDAKLPRIDVGLPMKFGNFYIQPKAGYVKKTLENMVPGSDDSYNAYVAGVDTSIKFGPITLSGEYTYGVNMGATNFTGGLTTQGPRVYTTGGVWKIEDEINNLWWAEIGWAISPMLLLRASYGQHKMENDNNPATLLDDVEFDRRHMAVNLRIALAPNFFVQPNWVRHDFGKAKLGVGASTGILKVNMGDTDYYGVSCYMLF